MINDFRYAWRTLRQNPGFAATAIISIALAIGANSAIFSLADMLLFRPLPVRDHDVNTNQVFKWRRQYKQGRLEIDSAPTTLLPVKVSPKNLSAAPAKPR